MVLNLIEVHIIPSLFTHSAKLQVWCSVTRQECPDNDCMVQLILHVIVGHTHGGVASSGAVFGNYRLVTTSGGHAAAAITACQLSDSHVLDTPVKTKDSDCKQKYRVEDVHEE